MLFFPVCAEAQGSKGRDLFTERGPAYFFDRYGSAKSSKNVSRHSFIHPTRGGVVLEGQFSVREFRSGELIVQAVFELPSLKLAVVTLRLPRQWTLLQVEAALAAYSADWKPGAGNLAVKTWKTHENAMAVFLLSSLEIQSPQIVNRVARALQEADAQRAAIPKF
jgi:hypothetical protein